VVVAAKEHPPQTPAAGFVGRTYRVVAIRIRYPALPATAIQANVGGDATPVAPFAGAESVGAANNVPMLKLKTLDHAAVPVLAVGSMACTCQK